MLLSQLQRREEQETSEAKEWSKQGKLVEQGEHAQQRREQGGKAEVKERKNRLLKSSDFGWRRGRRGERGEVDEKVLDEAGRYDAAATHSLFPPRPRAWGVVWFPESVMQPCRPSSGAKAPFSTNDLH